MTSPEQSTRPSPPYLIVDAACDQSTGSFEYKGVVITKDQATGKEKNEILFQHGPFNGGTNNIGEFLAVVHALAKCDKDGLTYPIYSDSQTAIAWIRNKSINTGVTWNEHNTELKDTCVRAVKWLHGHPDHRQVQKWVTKLWGENPADFGNKTYYQPRTNTQELLTVMGTKDIVAEIIKRINTAAVDGEVSDDLETAVVDLCIALDIQPMLIQDETFPAVSIDDELKITHLQGVWQKYSLSEIEQALP